MCGARRLLRQTGFLRFLKYVYYEQDMCFFSAKEIAKNIMTCVGKAQVVIFGTY